MARVKHFEFPADNPDRAIEFYSNVFGWKFHKWEGPMEYWLVQTGSEEAGIDGGMTRRQDPGSAVVNTIEVSKLDDTIKSVEQRGGRTVVPRTPIPGVGYIAYFHDPEGNMFGLIEPDTSAK